MTAAPTGTPPPARRDDIDVLRGFAILAVLLLHAGLMTTGIDAQPGLTTFVQRLSTGMQLFFVLSGFLISTSLDRSVTTGEGVRGFLVRRAAKLAPLYLLFLHVNLALFWLASMYFPQVAPFRNSANSSNVAWSNYLLHLAFLQGFSPARLHTLLDGSWSIVIEAYFYLLFPFVLARGCRTALGSAWMYAGSLVVAIAFIVLIGRQFSGYSHYGFPAQLPCFLLGVLAHRLTQLPGFTARFAPWHKVVIAATTVLMVGMVKGESKPLGDSNVYALCFAAILLASSTLVDLLPRFATRLLATWGRQSYALFFVHLVLLKLTYLWLAANQISLTLWPALALNVIVALPLSWLLSALVFDRIDRFFVALAARSLARQQHKPLDWSRA